MKMILLSGESHKKKKNLDRFRRKFHYLIEDSLLNYLVSLFKYDIKLHNLRFFWLFVSISLQKLQFLTIVRGSTWLKKT